MFKRILLRFRDMKTIAKLIPGADREANSMGQETAGAEHFVLSALALEDNTAKNVFEKLGINAEKFKEAINTHYQQALSNLGIEQAAVEAEPVEAGHSLHESQPSGQDLMQSLYELKKQDKDRPLLSVHVLLAASTMEHGIIARTLNVLGVEREKLTNTARAELEAWR